MKMTREMPNVFSPEPNTKAFGPSLYFPSPFVRPLSLASRERVHSIGQDMAYCSGVHICRDSPTLSWAADATAGIPYHPE